MSSSTNVPGEPSTSASTSVAHPPTQTAVAQAPGTPPPTVFIVLQRNYKTPQPVPTGPTSNKTVTGVFANIEDANNYVARTFQMIQRQISHVGRKDACEIIYEGKVDGRMCAIMKLKDTENTIHYWIEEEELKLSGWRVDDVMRKI